MSRAAINKLKDFLTEEGVNDIVADVASYKYWQKQAYKLHDYREEREKVDSPIGKSNGILSDFDESVHELITWLNDGGLSSGQEKFAHYMRENKDLSYPYFRYYYNEDDNGLFKLEPHARGEKYDKAWRLKTEALNQVADYFQSEYQATLKILLENVENNKDQEDLEFIDSDSIEMIVVVELENNRQINLYLNNDFSKDPITKNVKAKKKTGSAWEFLQVAKKADYQTADKIEVSESGNFRSYFNSNKNNSIYAKSDYGPQKLIVENNNIWEINNDIRVRVYKKKEFDQIRENVLLNKF